MVTQKSICTDQCECLEFRVTAKLFREESGENAESGAEGVIHLHLLLRTTLYINSVHEAREFLA